METAYFVGFSVVAGAFFLLFSVVSLVYWVQLRRLEQTQNERYLEFAEKAEPEQLERAVQTAESSAARIDNALVTLGKFREGVHSEMQRFYGIMRRNEKTLERDRVEQTPEDEVPQEIDPADLKPATPDAQGKQLTKAELRAIAREKGIKI